MDLIVFWLFGFVLAGLALLILVAVLFVPALVGLHLHNRRKQRARTMAVEQPKWSVVRPADGGVFEVQPPSWWDGLSGLERVGTVAAGVVGGAVLVAVVAPGLITCATGGALGGVGAWFLKKGLKAG